MRQSSLWAAVAPPGECSPQAGHWREEQSLWRYQCYRLLWYRHLTRGKNNWGVSLSCRLTVPFGLNVVLCPWDVEQGAQGHRGIVWRCAHFGQHPHAAWWLISENTQRSHKASIGSVFPRGCITKSGHIRTRKVKRPYCSACRRLNGISLLRIFSVDKTVQQCSCKCLNNFSQLLK